jgi:hypothetical protein
MKYTFELSRPPFLDLKSITLSYSDKNIFKVLVTVFNPDGSQKLASFELCSMEHLQKGPFVFYSLEEFIQSLISFNFPSLVILTVKDNISRFLIK